jgi:glycine cleavage system aminomethyltransferase T
VPERGEKLLVSGKTVGSLTSVAQVPTDGRVVALGLLRTRYDQPGQVVEVSSQGKRWDGRVISLEQYAREGSGT